MTVEDIQEAQKTPDTVKRLVGTISALENLTNSLNGAKRVVVSLEGGSIMYSPTDAGQYTTCSELVTDQKLGIGIRHAILSVIRQQSDKLKQQLADLKV